MAVSDVTVINLESASGANQITLRWQISDPNINGLPYLQYDHVEIRYSINSDMSSPTVLSASVFSASYTHLPLLTGSVYYYQIRAINKLGQEGEWCSPVQGTESNVDSAAIATSWTPVTDAYVESASGALGAYTCDLRYKQSGSVTFFTLTLNISDLGTAAGNHLIIWFAEPYSESVMPLADSSQGVTSHVEDASGFVSLISFITYGTIYLFGHDGAPVLYEGVDYVVTGTYEVHS